MALKIFEVVQVCVCLFSHSDFLRSFDLTWLVCLIERAVSRPGPPPRLHSSIDVGFCVCHVFSPFPSEASSLWRCAWSELCLCMWSWASCEIALLGIT